MLAHITPSSLAGEIDAIASKSVAHRLIIIGALANGPVHISCSTTCADIDATVRCLEALGATVQRTQGGFDIKPTLKSNALGLLKALHGATLDCGESGSTLRFMLPIACALGAEATLTGSTRLFERPLSPLSDQIVQAGASLERAGANALRTAGRMRPGRFELAGNVSSQFISGLLMAAPLLDGPSQVIVYGEVESRPYINLTIQAMRTYGVSVVVEHSIMEDGRPATVFTPQGTGYQTPHTADVEGDWSNAAFWLCAGAMGTEPVTVGGLSLSSAQGDRTIMAVLSRFGARMGRTPTSAIARPDKLVGFAMSAKDIPDLVPIIAAVASVAEGTTTISDCGRLRIKESDRLATVQQELSRLGAHIAIEGDSLVIEGVERLGGGTVSSHNDHRIAMMAAIAATRCEGPVTIQGAEATAKSYPDFFEHYRALGGIVELTEE